MRAATPAIALAVIVLAPFLNKAFTIDDPMFLYQARHLLEDPLHPTAFDVVWSIAPERMSTIMASGPGMAYLLVPCVLLGGAEWVAHLVPFAFLVAALVATASLARRLGAGAHESRAAALVLVATPAVAGMAGTAMPDVPAMALGVCGVERALAWSREGRWSQGAAATLLLSAAALCRSHMLVLAGVAWLAAAGDPFDRSAWSWRRWRSWVPFAACPLLVGIVLLVTRDPRSTATAVAGAAGLFVVGPAAPRNLAAFFAHWVLALPLGLPWLALHPRRIAVSPVVYLATAGAWLFLRSTPEVGPVFVAPAVGLGVAVFWDLVRDAVRRRDGVQLALSVWLVIPAVVLPYLHLPSKYLLAAAPAAALAVARELTRAPAARARAVLAATVAAGLALGLLILRADARFGALGRRAAAELVAPHVAAGRSVWFNGHWGFQWYAERAGARPLTKTPPHPAWGDLVVSSLHAEDELMGAMPRRKRIAMIEDVRPGGRLMDRSLGAGFFSNGWGYLPWAWGGTPLDRYELWSIE